jgi:hypothetical protein
MANPVAIFKPAVGTTLQDTIAQPIEVSGIMAPSRPIAIVSHATDNTVLQLQNTVSQLQTTVANFNPTATAQTPAVCTNLSAVESPYKTADGSLKSLVSVSFVNTDPNFASASIWFTGYSGSSSAQYVASGTQSPVSFLCETTHETVTITVVAIGSDGSSLAFNQAPTTSVVLDGVQSAPPPPTIVNGSFVVTPIGYSFSFDVEGGLLADVISGYNVYRNTANTYAGSAQIQHIAQPATNTGTIQVSDPLPDNNSIDYYYWVTSVNTSGLESTPSGVGIASFGGYPQQVTNISAVESPYKTPDGSLLSLVAVDFTPAANDPYFSSVNIYFTGYNGNTLPQLMTNASTSPAEFLVETTHEMVTVTVTAVSASGSEVDFNSAPTCLVALDGVVSAPPSPSISQAQVALDGNLGWQFAFNIIGGLEFDQIDSYRIYHSESNVAPSSYYRTIPQPSTNVGTEVIQEITGDILFYWVSAVNTFGYESLLTPVPFNYIDPGNPPPSLPAPVPTTKVYSPTVSLNGWSQSAHVGLWEGQDAGGSRGTVIFGYSSSQSCQPFNNPGNAYDGNQTTAASWSLSHNAAYAGCVWSFSNFPGLQTGATITGATLSVVSDVLATAGINGEGSVYYSTNNGSTWTQVYLWDAHDASIGARSKRTDTVTLSTSINPAQIQVMACVHAHDDIQMDVYEISLSITQTANAGPGAVTGVTASLVSGNVQISWNALVPLTRTDILNYQVYRALHGAGYLNSHLEATITPTGASTYSWTDTQAHDGSWDYWVICQNTTGYSPASITVALQSATSMLYVSGATLESLKPAQAGADVTAGKSLDVLVDGNYARTPSGSSPTVGAGQLGWTPAATTTDPTINYGQVLNGSAWPSGVNTTHCYARWVGYIVPTVTGSYTIGVNSDDGANLIVGGVPLVQNLTAGQGCNGNYAYTQSGTITLQAGTHYSLVLEYQQGLSAYGIQLLWTPPSGSIAPIPSGNLSQSATSMTGNVIGKWWNGTSSLWYPTGSHYIDLSGNHANKTLDNIGDGTSYARVPTTIYGSGGNAIDNFGNLKLKNMKGIGGLTASPTVSSSFADLPELGTGNGAMTVSTKGNPCLMGANLNFSAVTSGGTVGGVTSIGWSPFAFTLGTTNPPAPPSISISISGNGSGSGASVSWSVQGNGAPPTSFTYTPTLGITPGSGYTSATATVTISNAPSGSGYANGTNTYGCSVNLSTPASGVPVQMRILMDGIATLGPFSTSSDSKGNAVFNVLQLLFPTSGSHSFQVQAEQLGSGATVTSVSRQFQLVELG